MSSSDESDHLQGGRQPNQKKRAKHNRACDVCRRRKIRCDVGQLSHTMIKCSNCISQGTDCTFLEAAQKKRTQKEYIKTLEERLASMENTLSSMNSTSRAFQGESSPFANPTQESSSKLAQNTGGDASHSSRTAIPNIEKRLHFAEVDESQVADSDDEFPNMRLHHAFKAMNLHPATPRYMGKSSIQVMAKKAVQYKSGKGGPKNPYGQAPAVWMPSRRDMYWNILPWETKDAQAALPPFDSYVFPDDDLFHELLNLYFAHVHPIWPILHQPIFRNAVVDGLHLRDNEFAAVVLLVCSIGSRYSQDHRVLLPVDIPPSRLSAGWKYFRQVPLSYISLVSPSTLYRLQHAALTVLFLMNTSQADSAWVMVGIGIRLAQDMGVHRKKTHGAENTVEDELWKRPFWVMVALDRIMSASFGKPSCTNDEDFDTNLPVECDDEYWGVEAGDLVFNQPEGKPAQISFLIWRLKLSQILLFSLRTLYNTKKSKALLGYIGEDWEQKIVSELDSALNQWIDSVPEHLRWDPNREDPIFFDQSSQLYASYYQTQIIVHRPFIPSNRKSSPLSFSSLAICANAARSCIHIADVRNRRSTVISPKLHVPLFTAAIMLLLHIWSGKYAGFTPDPAKEMAEVHKCMEIIKSTETVQHSSGRMWDSLYNLIAVAKLPLPRTPSPNVPPQRKRRHEDDADAASERDRPHAVAKDPWSRAHMTPPAHVYDSPLTVPTEQSVNSTASSTPSSQSNSLFALPLHTDDFGRIPLFGDVQFNMQPVPPATSMPSQLQPEFMMFGREGETLQGQGGFDPSSNFSGLPVWNDPSAWQNPQEMFMALHPVLSQMNPDQTTGGLSNQPPQPISNTYMPANAMPAPSQPMLGRAPTAPESVPQAFIPKMPQGFDWEAYVTSMSGMVQGDTPPYEAVPGIME